MSARQLYLKVNFKIRGVDFVANLIILESKGIDVILGMDCAMKAIKLTTPDGKELEYVAEPVVTAKEASNHVKLNQLVVNQGPVVPVVNQFSDVFPEELLGMPPD
jgi:hypothetical protein